MKSFSILQVLALWCFVSRSYSRYASSCNLHGQTCKPRYYSEAHTCNERQLLRQTTTDISYTYGYGPNVCKTEYVYGRNAYRYEYSCYKYRSYKWYHKCSCSCTKSSSGVCDVPITFTKKTVHCCTGYATSLSGDTHSPSKSGCPVVMKDTIYDCLDDLGLTDLQCLLQGTDLQMALQDEDKMITLFALQNNVIQDFELKNLTSSEIEEVLNRHATASKQSSAKLTDGESLETYIENCFLHVSVLKTYKRVWYGYYKWKTVLSGKDIYISGSKIDIPDACVATNGIVHLVNRPVECGNQTIADIVESDPNYSIFESLLRLVDKLDFLDRSDPLMTLFVPTNEAFTDARVDLGYDLVSCLRNNTDTLRTFLHYHMVCSGAEFSSILVQRKSLKTKACQTTTVHEYYHSKWSARYWWYKKPYKKTVQKTVCQDLKITVTDVGIEVGDDGVLLTGLDIVASNGVIHEISLPLLVPTIDFDVLCSGFVGAVPPPPPPPPPPSGP